MRLGELLLERGSIDVNELHTGLEACNRSGGRLGTQLLRFGFVTEKDLLEALSQQNSVPYIPEAILLSAVADHRATLPLEVQRKFQAVPFDNVHGRLMVAMTNPRDPQALDELSALTKLDIETCVATESAILKALAEADGETQEPEVEEASLTETSQPPPVVAPDWDELWTEPKLRAADLFRLQDTAPTIPGRMWVATFPGLTPLGDEGAAEAHIVLDQETFRLELQDASHRDDVADLFLRYISGYLPRAALFAVHRGKVAGWMARGQSVVTEDIQSLSIPVKEKSLFSKPYKTGEPFVGPIGVGDANDAVNQAMGDPLPIEIVVLPVQVKKRTVAFLVGDIPGEAALAVPIHELVAAANLVDVAFEILILKKKIQT